MCATLIGCAVEMPDSQLASYLQRKSVDDNVAAWSLTHLRDVQSRPISSVADAGNDSDDSVLNEEEERLLDRLMASQLAQQGGFVPQTPPMVPAEGFGPGFVAQTPKGTPGSTPRYCTRGLCVYGSDKRG